MRFLLVFMVAAMAVTSTQAGGKNKRGMTAAQYETLRGHYHRLCVGVEDPGVWVFGAKKRDVIKWCRQVAGYMYKTGHLPSVKRGTIGSAKREILDEMPQ